MTSPGIQKVLGTNIPGFNIPEYDEIILGYTGSNLTTVEYYKDSTLVLTLTLSYDASDNLTNVVKS